MSVFAEPCTLPGGCGVGVYAYFQDSPDSWDVKLDISLAPHSGGAGYLITHFIVGNKQCDEAYEILKERFPIVFESNKRKNKNSDNKVYFCVYDTKGKCESGFDAVAVHTGEDEGEF